MANVMFKRGTQAGFNNLTAYQDGCFYLTTDSHRLYVGTGNNKADLVSQSVITYPNWAAIQALSTESGLGVEGQFYYAKAENILCTYSGNKWVQINPDHNDDHDTYVKSVSVAKNATETEKGKQLVYDVKITQAQKDLKGNNEGAPSEVSGKLTISAADLGQITTHTDVGMEAEKSNSKVYLKNNGVGANTAAKVELAGGGSVSVSADGSNKITISGVDTTYSLNTTTNTTGAKAALQNQNGTTESSFAVEVDGNALIVESNTAGKNGSIKLAHATTLISDASYTPANATTDKSGNVTLSMPAVSVNEYGHVTAVGIKDVTLPRDKDTKVSAVSADNSGKITVKIKDESTTVETPVVSDAVLFHKITVDGVEKTVYNQGDLGAFYSSDKVDTLITAAKSEMNAMTYCGTVTKSAFDQITGPQKGDTYKAAESFTIGSGDGAIQVDTGDLIIYNGADVATDTTGDITKWEVIPSGDDIDTTYDISLNGTTIQLNNKVNSQTAGTIAVKGTDGISVINNSGLSIGHTNTVVAGAAKGTGLDSNRKFTIPTINYDKYGHITGLGPATTIELPADKDTTYTFGSDAKTKTVLLKNSSQVTTGSLQFTTSDNNFVVSMSNAHADKPVVDLKLATVTKEDSVSTNNVSYSPLSGGSEQVFTVAKAKVDDYGRVTGFENQTITLNTDQLTYNVSTNVADNILSINSSLAGKVGAAQSKSVKVKSGSLAFSKAEDVVSVDLVWGTF